MGFLDSLKSLLRGKGASSGSGGGRSSFGGEEKGVYRVYVRCKRCGEPLQSRISLANDLSLADDGESWIVRKGLRGAGRNLCFETVEVTLYFNPQKTRLLNAEVTGGELITAEEYTALLRDL